MDDLTHACLQQIQAVYPSLTITHVTTTSGQFSNVLVVNESLIFRFPKSAHVAAEMYRELVILDRLQGKLPLAIPRPTYVSSDAQRETIAFMGYDMIPGELLSRETLDSITDETILDQLAGELAGFLRALHQLPVSLFGTAFNSEKQGHAAWVEMYSQFQEKLFPFMRPDARQQVSANFEAALQNQPLWDFEPVICHGDFGTGNILYDQGHITGILDFTFCGLGDPAQDVGALTGGYGEEFIQRVFRYYPELRSTMPRARFLMSNYALLQALFALRDGNAEDFDDGMQGYR